MDSVRIGIVGLGSMGSKHFDTLARTKAAFVTAIATRSAEKRAAIAARFSGHAMADYRELLGKVDAVIVAVPTVVHAEIACFFLEHGVHVLLEKPITASVVEARMLVQAAQQADVVFQIGHTERFNPAYIRLQQALREHSSMDGQVAVQAFRMGPYDGRAQDVSVEFDLMIHDIDALAGLFPGYMLNLQAALGVRVVTGLSDSTQAHLALLKDGMPQGNAMLMASRIADAKRRVLRLVQGGFRAELDFMNQTLSVATDGGELRAVPVEKAFPLDGELSHFVSCIETGAQPAVSGTDGLRALEICTQVGERVSRLLAVK